MSNVLIGIIGVILFIGLALAGALFLGPRFQEATNNSRGSASIQAVSQISNALSMHRLQEGAETNVTLEELKTGGYLKSIPANPTGSGDLVVDEIPFDRTQPRYVRMTLGSNASAVCEAINRQSGVDGDPDTAGTQNPSAPTGTQGCANIVTGNFRGPGTNTFVVYARI
jgi:hypothetical protein